MGAEAAAAALAGFSGLAPRSLRRLLDVLAPSDAWELAVRGQLGEVVELRQGRAREVAERLSGVDPTLWRRRAPRATSTCLYTAPGYVWRHSATTLRHLPCCSPEVNL